MRVPQTRHDWIVSVFPELSGHIRVGCICGVEHSSGGMEARQKKPSSFADAGHLFFFSPFPFISIWKKGTGVLSGQVGGDMREKPCLQACRLPCGRAGRARDRVAYQRLKADQYSGTFPLHQLKNLRLSGLSGCSQYVSYIQIHSNPFKSIPQASHCSLLKFPSSHLQCPQSTVHSPQLTAPYSIDSSRRFPLCRLSRPPC